MERFLALASLPTFDPNFFSQRITSKEGRAEYQQLLNHPIKPLLNRAVQGRYPRDHLETLDGDSGTETGRDHD
jgi:penicillin-binding protein 2